MQNGSAAERPAEDRPAVAVLSVHTDTVGREEERSLEEMIYEASRRALAKSGISREELDGIVLSGHDQVDGRVISVMPSAGPAGGVDHDVTMIASSGEHALVYGYLRLLSGQGSNVLVIGWSKPSESVHPEHAELVGAEPYLLRAVGMNDTLAAALQASTWTPGDTAGQPSADADVVHDPVVSWPLTGKDLPARCDAVLAAVLAIDGSFTEGQELAWVHGAGWSTDRYELGARDLSEQTALHQALARLAASGAAGPARWTAAEIAAPSEPAVHVAAGTLGLAEQATVNASGSLTERPAPTHVAGLARLLAAAEAVSTTEDVAEPLAVGVGLNGFAGQGSTAMLFGREKG